MPNNFKNILIAGCKNGQLKYIDTVKGKMVTIITDHKDLIGDMVCLEKLKINESDLEFFHKNLNFVLMGSRSLGLFSGYGTGLRNILPTNAEDFSVSNILPNRNMCLLKVSRSGRTSDIKLAVVS